MKRLFLCMACSFLLILSASYGLCAEGQVVPSSKDMSHGGEVSIEKQAPSNVEARNIAKSYSIKRTQPSGFYFNTSKASGNDVFSWQNTERMALGDAGANVSWDSLEYAAAGLSSEVSLGQNGVFLYGLELARQYERENPEVGNFSASGTMAYGYRFDENMMLKFGATGKLTAVNSTVLPVLGVSYFDGTWDVSVGFPETNVTYHMTDALSLTALAKYDSQTYNLSEPNPAYDEGYVEISKATASLRANWSPLEDFQLSLGPEMYFARSTRFYDADGDPQGGTDDSDVGYGVRAGMSLAF